MSTELFQGSLLPTETAEQEQPSELEGQFAFFPEYESERDATHEARHRPMSSPAEYTLEEWKLSILMSDILLRFNGSLPENWLYEILVGSGHMLPFWYDDTLGGLIENGSAVYENTEQGKCVTLTPAGTENVRRTRLLVPKLFRDRVHLTALRYVARQEALRELRIDYEDCGQECCVCLQCSDHGREMFFLRISAPSRDSAEELGERILRNPSRFFGKIIDFALTNEEEPFDLTDN
ncbi:MAG: DUF4364 family protein [Oscillospiraceae bacterium]|nr:DUF4364 family protein [Oscillospiraceae bacterium]